MTDDNGGYPLNDDDSPEYVSAYDEICAYVRSDSLSPGTALFRLLNYVALLESKVEKLSATVLSLQDELTDRVDAIELRVDADQSRLDSVLEVNGIWDGS